jgi:hypothetical protein
MKLVVGIPMMASTLDVSRMDSEVEVCGLETLELVASVPDVVLRIEDGESGVAAEVDPTPVDV